MEEPLLTSDQAYRAMYAYFSQLYERTKLDEIGILLGEMSLLEDGGTADPAAWYDWQECIQKSLDGVIDAQLKFSYEKKRPIKE